MKLYLTIVTPRRTPEIASVHSSAARVSLARTAWAGMTTEATHAARLVRRIVRKNLLEDRLKRLYVLIHSCGVAGSVECLHHDGVPVQPMS